MSMTEERLLPWLVEKLADLLSASNRLPPALLLHGARGLGKFQFARHFAKAILCELPVSRASPACGQCNSCALFDAGTHPDFLLVRPEDEDHQEEGESGPSQTKPSSLISVSAIRTLTQFNQFSISRGRAKIAVVHPAELMNRSAANALLKTLEEPMAGLRILLVSHRPGRLPATVRSRCSEVVFTRPDRDLAIRWLEEQHFSNASSALDQAAGAPLLAQQQHADKQFIRALQAVNRLLKCPDDQAPLHDLLECEPELVVSLLQKGAADQIARMLCGRDLYQVTPSPLVVRNFDTKAVTWFRWYQSLVSEARFARHPLNQRLRYERILNSVPSPSDN